MTNAKQDKLTNAKHDKVTTPIKREDTACIRCGTSPADVIDGDFYYCGKCWMGMFKLDVDVPVSFRYPDNRNMKGKLEHEKSGY